MSRSASLLALVHTAPGRPSQPVGRQLPWRGVLPVALLGLLFAALLVGNEVGLPDRFEPAAPFNVGYKNGLDDQLRERGVDLPPEAEISRTGYDGQWFLGQASDPLLVTDLSRSFDAPRYRSIRVLYPAAGWLLAAGRPAATPYALLLLGIFAVGLGCAACARIVSGYRRSPWWGAGFVAIPGVLVGVANGTAEPFGLALAALGVTLALDRRYLWAGLAFAGAGLAKETFLGFALATAVFLAVDRQMAGRSWLRPAAAVAVPGVASLLTWWGYVNAVLPPESNPHGTLGRFQPPLVGWGEVLITIARGDYPGRVIPVLFTNEAVLIVTFLILFTAVALALWLRQSLLAYLALGWGLYGLVIAGFLLERFGSAQRALAPAVLACGLFLVTARVSRRAVATPEPALTGAPDTSD